MKKLVVVLMSLVLAVALILPAPAAEETKVNVYDKGQIKSIVFAIGVNQYFVNGQVSGVTMDAAPYIDSDRTFVPVRFLGNALGITNENITWDDSRGRATLQAGNTRAELAIGKKLIITNGKARDIDVAPQLQPPGRTFLPARFVCEALGYEVDWQNDKYVLVWPKGQPKPDIEGLKNQIEKNENITEANGYRVPVETNLHFPPSETVDMGVLVLLYKSLDSQYQDLNTILLSKFESQTVNEIISYVKQKKDWKQELPLKKWKLNSYAIEVISNAGNDCIQIVVRK